MTEAKRIRQEYANRKQRLLGSDLYSFFNPSHLFATHQRQRATLAAIKKHGITDLSELSIFELGCGYGGVLLEFLHWGASSRNLYGIDLLADRLDHARAQSPACHFVNADGQNIPFPAKTFDIVAQFTALSSILDAQICQQVARDMLRVLRPTGFILWYDFWLNPTNQQTRGLPSREIKRLFPNCHYDVHRITLAPPLTRRLATVSWGLCLFLESLKIFNTHYLVAISPARTR